MTGPGIHLQKRLSRAGKTTLIGLVAAIMSWVVLFGTLQAALRLPSEERLAPLARAGTLDYSRGTLGVFESLRSSFIAEVLGLEQASRGEARVTSSNGGALLAAPTVLAPTDLLSGRPARTIVEHPFDNDDFGAAHPISSIPFTARTDSSGADRERGEPEGCEPGGGTVWYRYRPDRNIGLFANTFGSRHAIALGVFRGRGLESLTLVDCEFDTEGDAQVVFPAKKNRTYFFQIAAPVTDGPLAFSLDPLGTTSLVSVARDGKDGADREAKFGAVSADGRYVSFQSDAENIGRRRQKGTCYWNHSPHDREAHHGCMDIFVRDMVTGRTELVSKNSRGVSSNGTSQGTAISGDGRYVVFKSVGTNLVPRDNNDTWDVFVHDRVTRRTERVSVSSEGEEGAITWAWNRTCKDDVPPTIPEIEQGQRQMCKSPTNDIFGAGLGISSDGRYVIFQSELHGLVEPEPPHCTDLTSSDEANANHGPGVLLPVDAGPWACRQIYVHDLKTHETRLLSVSSDGDAGNGDSAGPFMSRNGRWIAFSSSADNLVAGDNNGYRDVFVHDLRTGATELASVSAFGIQGDAQSGGTSQRGHATVSDDGRWAAFVSHASNLVEEDGNHTDDVFLKDLTTGQVILVTGTATSPSGPADLAAASHSSISTDGRYVAFTAELNALQQQDLYVYDRVTDTITRVSVSSTGEPATEGSFSNEPELSADGHYVVFHSTACNLDKRYREHCQDGDEAAALDWDVFLHELPWTR